MPGFLQNALGQNNLYTPYAGTNPMGTLSFNNGSWNQSLSPQQQQFNTMFGNRIGSNMGNGSMTYNPNTSFLPQAFSNFQANMPGAPSTSGIAGVAGNVPNFTQYGNVGTVGNAFNNASMGLLNSNSSFNSNWNNLFKSSVQAQSPYIQQFLQNNADNEFAKGTLASTAGQYQTMGADQAVLNNLNSMQNSAFGNAANLYGTNLSAANSLGATGSGLNLQQGGLLGNLANTQFGNRLNSQQALFGANLNAASLGTQQQQALFGAANQTANLGEQQAEFGPQFSTGQTQGLFNNIMGQNSQLGNLLQQGLMGGWYQGNVNKSPSVQQSASAGLLNGLLFGNGSGGLVNSLLGIPNGAGNGTALNSLGSILGNLGGSAINGLENMFGGNSSSSPGLNYNLNTSGGSSPFSLGSNYDPTTGSFGSPSSGGSDPFSMTSGYDPTTGSYDSGNLNNILGFNGAGGQAAAQMGPSLSQGIAPAAGAALNLASGNPIAQAQGALQSAQLGNAYLNGNNSDINTGLGNAGLGLGIYQGIRQGGVAGDTMAAANSAQMATNAGYLGGSNGLLGSAAGYVGIPLSVYNTIKNWQSGNTGADAMNGASTGASIGTAIEPGLGTAIGAVIGGAAGAVSSAFGGGKHDPETDTWNSFVPQFNSLDPQQQQQVMSSMSPQQNFAALTGVFDGKNNSAGSADQLEQKFGRMGENNFMTSMGNYVNEAIRNNMINANASPSQIYSQVVAPWLKSQGVTVGQTGTLGTSNHPGDIVGTNQQDGAALQDVITNLIGQWQSGAINGYTPIGGSGQTISGMPTFNQSSSFGQSPITTMGGAPPSFMQTYAAAYGL